MLAAIGTGRADSLIGYWDLNGDLDRAAGTSGLLSASFEGAAIASLGFGSGTVLNRLDSSYPAGTSLEFFDLASVIEVAHVTLSNLDFRGLTSPTISFAVQGDQLFTLEDYFHIEYNTGSGWISVDLPKPATNYAVESYTFNNGQLDDQPQAEIRISFSTVATVVDVVNFDNIQVNAVPEPSSLALLVGTSIACMFIRQRRKCA